MPPIPPLSQAKYLALHTNKTDEDIIRDFQRPRYFNPYEAVQYGLIDQVRFFVCLAHCTVAHARRACGARARALLEPSAHRRGPRSQQLMGR